ncbi:phosphotransferase family protein [Streptomyces tropicalis]|uniref:Phosphotransferase n=1 Tax=Streptomyces tropicalis TaxID=3034234 RepID=A0ABT5ZYW5_9ACTN|nr:phosphotransferase [Streptomyces tropicalis]MDF3297581.1 phosphotransferase [Streptomyces tropicalis]
MRRGAGVGDLSLPVREALGAGCRVVAAERLRGGSRKGVYRVHVEGAPVPSAIVYVWAAEENYWPEAGRSDGTGTFAPASGTTPFLTAQHTLAGLGVRVPEVLLADDSGRRGPGGVAVVEDIGGGTLEALLRTDPARATVTLHKLAEMLDAMHHHRARRPGRTDLPGPAADSTAPPPPTSPSCAQLVLDRALEDLGEAAGREDRIASTAGALRARLHELAARVGPRTEFGLVHGELGPDHVLVDADGHPVLIDIEGLMHFDAEWEHVFLRLRFGRHYAALAARRDLDPRRLDLYRLAQHLSLVAGPLRLLDGDFPDRTAMRGIIEHNIGEALALVP